MSSNESPNRSQDELLSAYLDGELPEHEREQVEVRLAQDTAARQTLAELRAVAEAVRQLPPEPIGTSLRETVLARVSTRAEQGTAAGDSAEKTRLESSTFSWGRSPRGWLWAGMAVAAALLVMVVQQRHEAPESAREVAHRGGDAAGEAVSGGQPVPELRSAPSAPEPRPLAEQLEADYFFVETEDLGEEVSEPATASTSTGVTPEDELRRDSVNEGAPSLVVHVTMPRAAREQRVLENLLVSNSIEFDSPVSEVDPSAKDARTGVAESTRATVPRSQDDQTALSAAVVAPATSSVNQPKGRAQRATMNGERLARPVGPVDSPREGDGVEVILVEAAPAEVESCLSAMQQDEDNFLAVEVEGGTVVENHALHDTQLGAYQANRSQTPNWRRYSRGQVPTAQRGMAMPTSGDGVQFGEFQYRSYAGREAQDRVSDGRPADAILNHRLRTNVRSEQVGAMQVLFVVGTPPSAGASIAPSGNR